MPTIIAISIDRLHLNNLPGFKFSAAQLFTIMLGIWLIPVMFHMVQYDGWVTDFGVRLLILGDGTAKSIQINLTKAPFNMPFTGSFYPTYAFAHVEDVLTSKPVLSFPAPGVLQLDYPTPVPAPSTGRITPRSQFDVYLFYPAIVIG